MRNFSSMIEEVRSQTSEVMAATDRLRTANRRLTGSTGEAPTPLTAKGNPQEATEPPLMEALAVALEHLNSATGALRNEITHLEGVSETRRDEVDKGMATAAEAKSYR